MGREQIGQDLPSPCVTLIARDQMAETRSLPMVARNTGMPTARPPQRSQFQNKPFGPRVRVSVLPQFGQVNMVAGSTHFGNKSATSARSSFNSFTVASIFARLNSLTGTP